MRVHCLQHAGHETLGSIEPWLKKRRHAISCTRLYAGEALPPPESLDWLAGDPGRADEHLPIPQIPLAEARAAVY